MNVHTTDPHGRHEPRVEDHALVSGAGRFIDDAAQPGQLHAHFVRAPHAFARIRKLDTEAARKAPGVVAVFTAADMEKAGITNITRAAPQDGRGGSKLIVPFRPALAIDRVLHKIGRAHV